MILGLAGIENRLVIVSITTFVSFCLWYAFEYARKSWLRFQIAKRIRKIQAAPGENVIALIVSVSRDIRPDVRRYLDAYPVSREVHISQVHHEGGLDRSEIAWQQYLERVRMEHRTITAAGAQRILLFCNLPVAMAVVIGTTLLPGPEVVVHHFQDNQYHTAALLNTAIVRN